MNEKLEEVMKSDGLLFQGYSEISQLLVRDRWKEVDLRFDEAQREFDSSWTQIHAEFGTRPHDAPVAAKELIVSQPQVIGLTLAMARCDSVQLFGRFKRFLEYILKRTERLSGYPAIAGVPRLQAGFLYMAATVMAFHWEAWDLFEKLLTTKFEWYYQSGRPIFNYAFDLPYFFHSDAFGRDAAKAHDFYRMELIEPELLPVTGLNNESTVDTYVQTQMLMCLKVAQLRESGGEEIVSIWPDFGRFYGERVGPLFDRAYANREYARGFLRAFNEDPDTFFRRLNDRLAMVQSIFWRGSPYFYESIVSWEPNQTHA